MPPYVGSMTMIFTERSLKISRRCVMVPLSIHHDLPHEFRYLVLTEIFGLTSLLTPLNRQQQPDNSIHMELLAWLLAWGEGGISFPSALDCFKRINIGGSLAYR
jgi:hypothetical protein